MSPIYVYAIVPAMHRQTFDVGGLSVADPQVCTICGNGVAAVVGASPPIDFRALSREEAVRYLLAHQRVVEAVMRIAPTLPVKFGTTLPDEAVVARLLERGGAVLAARLAEISQQVQVELIVTWSVEEALREVAAEEAVAQLKSKIEAQGSAATNDSRIALGRLVKESIDCKRESYRRGILAALRPIGTDVAENALMDDCMVANLALLIPVGASELLDQRLAQLDAEFNERLNFRCVGPLPPYSFATVEVSLPSFDVIDQARRALNLGDSANLADIKTAYRRLIQRIHPDHGTALQAADGAPARLTDAYKTLISYATALPSMAGVANDCRFDRDAVEGTILVAVRRQELAAAGLEGAP
ncbi:MAG: GvpL/GvpF family gas vesicle protein [Hyphomicrobium sp.]|nr:GvpL/GvpF family gas vesicle protein [Hyphomicrobium sp.]